MSIMMEYLRQLQKNNQRDWFQSHKELRKEAEAEFEELLHASIPPLTALRRKS